MSNQPEPRTRKLSGRIISFGGQPSGVDLLQEIPFRPAYDLLEQQEKRLTQEQVAAIGLALFKLTTRPDDKSSNWALQSRLSGIGRRI